MTVPKKEGAIAVNIPQTLHLTITHAEFVKLAQANRELQLERTARGELIIVPPAGSITGNRNADISGQLWLWNRQTKLGVVFDSSTGFQLPNGAGRAPDAAWIHKERWEALSLEEQETFAPICPDLVVELRSRNDTMESLRTKMEEYRENGASLGWLIDRKNRQVEIYRQGEEVEILDNPASLSGEEILPGFVLDLTEVWR